MTSTQVALLRGVNVGGRAQIKMAELRQAFEDLGFTDVSTYIQSGNVMFTSTAAVKAERVERAIMDGFGMDVAVFLRTAAQLAKVIERNPFPKADSATLHVGFMAKAPPASTIRGLDLERFHPEEAAVKGTEVYLHLPNGMGRAKLPEALGRQLKVPMTVRNWNSVTKLAELART